MRVGARARPGQQRAAAVERGGLARRGDQASPATWCRCPAMVGIGEGSEEREREKREKMKGQLLSDSGKLQNFELNLKHSQNKSCREFKTSQLLF
jgi:hypothetical protein